MSTPVYHIIPTFPSLKVTGAAARSVQAADDAGMARHLAVVAAQQALVLHVDGTSEIDATWCAQVLRLIKREADAIKAVADLTTRWKMPVQCVLVHRGHWYSYHAKNLVEKYRHDLALAGIPLETTGMLTPEFWDDAAMRGC